MYISASVEMTAHKRIGDIESQHSIRYTPLDLFGIRQSTDSLYDLHVHRRVILLLCGMIAMSINRFKLNIEIELWDVSVSTGGSEWNHYNNRFCFSIFFFGFERCAFVVSQMSSSCMRNIQVERDEWWFSENVMNNLKFSVTKWIDFCFSPKINQPK